MKSSMKKSVLVIVAVLVASISIFAQTQLAEKLYKNEKEKKELVTAIMQDQELKAELMNEMVADKKGCKMMGMMDKGKEGKKSCPMMGAMMDMKDMKDCPMMANAEASGEEHVCTEMCAAMRGKEAKKSAN